MREEIEHTIQDLETNGSDNPSCPQCKHYNAMLVLATHLPASRKGVHLSACRDCGFRVIGRVFRKVIRGGKKK